jgi:hypothetical protein
MGQVPVDWHGAMELRCIQQLLRGGTHKELTMELLVTVLIVLIVMGLALYLVNNFLPIDRRIKMVINAVIVLLEIIYLLRVAGLLGGSASVD